jgi:mono/diheme cytochrome c family protein
MQIKQAAEWQAEPERKKMSIRFVVMLFVLASQMSVAGAQGSANLEHGRALMTRMCARCHAVGLTGKSPHPAAPPFRRLHRVTDLDGLVDRLRRGLMVAHPDMPTFRFSRRDARAVATYLGSIQRNE